MSPDIITKDAIADSGCYLYCVADSSEIIKFGKIGLDGNEVYTISFANLCAVVHNCPSEPYKSNDNEIVKNWVLSHEKVVETAWTSFGVILPFGFDTIIRGKDGIDASSNVKNWIKENSFNLIEKMNKIKGKAEYGIQILWDPSTFADRIKKSCGEIVVLKREMETKPKGTAYMISHKIENIVKKEIGRVADLYYQDFYARITKIVDGAKVEKIKKPDGNMQMLMNLSCLVDNDKLKALGEKLGEVNQEDGFAVRFTGPWPPYSFVDSV